MRSGFSECPAVAGEPNRCDQASKQAAQRELASARWDRSRTRGASIPLVSGGPAKLNNGQSRPARDVMTSASCKRRFPAWNLRQLRCTCLNSRLNSSAESSSAIRPIERRQPGDHDATGRPPDISAWQIRSPAPQGNPARPPSAPPHPTRRRACFPGPEPTMKPEMAIIRTAMPTSTTAAAIRRPRAMA